VNRRADESLLLDEMFAPALAESLSAAGFDVVAVAGHPVLAAASDHQVAAWATEHGRRVVTENVRDFAQSAGRGEPPLRVLLTSARSFPRSRRNPGPLLKALSDWLGELEHPVESWLR
jgi:predicted nuclease of predicted toxin-antitoxin system